MIQKAAQSLCVRALLRAINMLFIPVKYELIGRKIYYSVFDMRNKLLFQGSMKIL